MRVLVTGGAGYVGSVSVEALVAAGHDVVVLDDLSRGHRDALPDGVRLVQGSYGDPATRRAAAPRHARRRRAPLRGSLARRRIRGRPGPLLPRERGRRGRIPRGAPRGRRAPPRLQLHRRGLRDAGQRPDPRGRGPGADQPVRRDEAHLRGRPALVRGSVRTPVREPALLQRGRRLRAQRRGPRPGDSPDPERAGGRRGPRRADRLRDRLPDTGRDVHPRLPARGGPGARPSARARGHLARRSANRRRRCEPGPRRSRPTSGTGAASASATSCRPPRPWSGTRSRTPSGSAGRAIRRSSLPMPRAPGSSSAGGPITATSWRSWRRPGRGGRPTRTATEPDGSADASQTARSRRPSSWTCVLGLIARCRPNSGWPPWPSRCPGRPPTLGRHVDRRSGSRHTPRGSVPNLVPVCRCMRRRNGGRPTRTATAPDGRPQPNRNGSGPRAVLTGPPARAYVRPPGMPSPAAGQSASPLSRGQPPS